jgi:hypothetical protein
VNDLNERARALIDTAKSQGGLTPERRARLTASISAATAAGAALAGTGSASAAAPAAASVIKLGVVGLLAVGVGVGGTWTVSRLVTRSPRAAAPVSHGAPASTREAAPSAAPAVPAEPVVVARAGDERPPAAPTPTPTPARAPKPNAASPEIERPAPAAETPPVFEAPPAAAPEPLARGVEEDSTAEEVRALSQATEALRARDFERARTLARGARMRFPRGVLRAELTLVEIEALCGLQRTDDARSLADTLTSGDRTALVVDRLGRSCAGPGGR